jgi:hypothetical protein
MKIKLCALMAVALMAVAMVEAQNIGGTTPKGFRWMLDTSTGRLTVSGTGEMDNFFLKPAAAPWYEHHLHIREVVIQQGVTSIGNYAFHNCYRIEKVTIPENTVRIGEYAFSRCRELIPSAIVHIQKVGYVADNAFLGCKVVHDTMKTPAAPSVATKRTDGTSPQEGSGRFVISAASHTGLQSAKKHAAALQSQYGCTCEIFESVSKGVKWYRVTVYTCDNKKEAEAEQAAWASRQKGKPWILERTAAGKNVTAR